MTKADTMEAVVLPSPGAAFSRTTVPVPPIGPGEVLVRIQASGINPLDLKIRSGRAPHAKQSLPAILGMDMAGTVEVAGPNVTGFMPGDEVYGLTGGVGGLQGSLATYAAVDARLLAHKPRNLSMAEAAALPLVFITAWEGLVDRAKVEKGQSVLVLGAGGVGQQSIQIAQSFGANVFAVDGGSKQARIRELGATAIDFDQVTVAEYVSQHTNDRGFDLVYDTVGGAALDAAFTAVRTFGHVVSCLGWGTHSLAHLSFRAATYSGVFTLLPMLTGEGRAHHGEILREATRLVEAGKVKPFPDPRRFTLSSVEDAFTLIHTGEARGKVIVETAE